MSLFIILKVAGQADVAALISRKRFDLMLDLNKKYLLDVKYFYTDEDQQDKRFASALNEASLLYIGQFSSGKSYKMINKNAKAVKKFFKSGGTVYFDYQSLSPQMNKFFGSVGVHNPYHSWGAVKGRNYTAIINKNYADFPLLNTPHKLDGEFHGYGWWKKWTSEQIPLIIHENDRTKAGLIIQPKVMGKGTVIFSRVPLIFRKRKGKADFLENILTYAFAENILDMLENRRKKQGGPGRDVPLK
jgi:hypothetical protein